LTYEANSLALRERYRDRCRFYCGQLYTHYKVTYGLFQMNERFTSHLWDNKRKKMESLVLFCLTWKDATWKELLVKCKMRKIVSRKRVVESIEFLKKSDDTHTDISIAQGFRK